MADFEEFNQDDDILDEDDVITLTSEDGEEIDFYEIAGIAHDGEFYVILQPVELPPDMSPDEALVFEASLTEDGQDHYSIVTDEEIIDAVFDQYNKLIDEAEGEE